ncbi:hypothetical protein A3F52_02225 [Candidatus Uhrbacteria bacterium RIFCSPHIGHO2_12_FULL_47_11]|nr:MAG: hypothetical protein A3F52_02225 [Candidatus Uhrbacteria bacterium RIFCSPHIGHO2_12_FULL_47_11]
MKKQKPWIIAAGFGAVIVLGLGTFALAMSTFPERLRAPFHLLSADELKSLSQSRTAEEELFTSTKDTDRDGIPDAQELQIYRTSPFLEDTDSDGIIDKAEIEAGTDPNCPKGTDCRALALPSARETEQNEITKSLYQTSITAKLEKIGVPGFSDPASIRNFLRQAGVSEDVLPV